MPCAILAAAGNADGNSRAAARAAWARHLAQMRMPARAAQSRHRPGPLFAATFVADDPPPRQPAGRPDAKILPFPARGRRDPTA